MTVWQMSAQLKHAPDLSCVSRNLKRDVQTFEGKTMSNCLWTIPLVCWCQIQANNITFITGIYSRFGIKKEEHPS